MVSNFTGIPKGNTRVLRKGAFSAARRGCREKTSRKTRKVKYSINSALFNVAP